jgi:hypothetical protein
MQLYKKNKIVNFLYSDVGVQRGGKCGGQHQQQSEQSEQQQHQRADQQDINFQHPGTVNVN